MTLQDIEVGHHHFVDNCNFIGIAVCLLHAHFHSYFFVLEESHSLLFTDDRFSSGRGEGFPQLSVGPWSGFTTSTHGLHSFIVSLYVFVSSLVSHRPSLCITKQGVWLFRFIFLFLPPSERFNTSRSQTRGRGESEWNWITILDDMVISLVIEKYHRSSRWHFSMTLLDDQLSFATSYLSEAITLLTCFGVLHTSTSPNDFMSVHNDV